jgi:transposase
MIEINEEKYYSQKEVAEKFNVGTATVAGWRRRGELISYPLNKRKHLFSEEQIEKFIKRNGE